MSKKKIMSVLLTAGLVLSVNAANAQGPGEAPNSNAASAFDNKIIKKISADNMYNTIALLSKEPRTAGTPGAMVSYAIRLIKLIKTSCKKLRKSLVPPSIKSLGRTHQHHSTPELLHNRSIMISKIVHQEINKFHRKWRKKLIRHFLIFVNGVFEKIKCKYVNI
jgi:hypothetical protein